MLRSTILAGNDRLDGASFGGPSIKRAPPADDIDAVRRIQTALKELGYPMPISFMSGGPDGGFGEETYRMLVAFQRNAFPDDPSQWDGRAGRNTLTEMDDMLTASPETTSLPDDVTISSVTPRSTSDVV